MKSGCEPRIGIALGSGAAKGFAHIGVLKFLDDMGIKPHVIAGTSMGAFVGAAYSAGYLEKLEDWVRLLDNWKVFSLLDINWTLSGGILGGKKPFRTFFDNFEFENIEDLPIPFTAVATDLHSGQEIWLQQGNLQDAVSASCSIPGLLSAKSLSGRWLVDGAVVNPVPVDVCRAMGATCVIAVDVTEDGAPLMQPQQAQVQKVVSQESAEAPAQNAYPVSKTRAEAEAEAEITDQLEIDGESHGVIFSRLLEQGKEQFNQFRGLRNRSRETSPGMLDTMSQAMAILERRHKRARMVGAPPDVLIMPKVGSIGGLEFSRAAEAVDAGEAEARRLRTWIEDMVQNHR
ncbi:patatin-like phospholipase family protein [Microbulbifer sp. SA54]|uniref:patatin-like phospholipase family protein n=1 Tax=Microbulbifer sp. SA54 TaxID=3401577 RepID=UPI003AAC9E21